MAQAVPTQPQAHTEIMPTQPDPGTAVGAVAASLRARQATRVGTPVAQASLPRALPVGGAHSPHLRSVPADLPDLRRPDAPYRLHHRQGRDKEDTGAHRRGPPQAPRSTPARGPPLWDDWDAPVNEGVEALQDWGMAAQPAPDYQVDQRVNW